MPRDWTPVATWWSVMSRRSSPLRAPADAGFTLLEILVALAIAATGIAAVAKITASAADVSFETEKRMVAVWVAGNRLSELRVSRAWPSLGTFDHKVDMGGRSWYVTDTVSETERPDLRRLQVTVFTDPERGAREFSLQGYLARYAPPEEAPEAPAEGEETPEAETGTTPEAPGDDAAPQPGAGQEAETPDVPQADQEDQDG